MKNKKIILNSVIYITIFISPAYGEVFKCIDEKNRITFTDSKCKKNQKSTNVIIQQTNITDSKAEKQEIENFKKMKAQKKSENSYKTLNNKPYDDPIKRENDQRMNRMTSPLPNGLGTGRGCYMEHRQLYCY